MLRTRCLQTKRDANNIVRIPATDVIIALISGTDRVADKTRFMKSLNRSFRPVWYGSSPRPFRLTTTPVRPCKRSIRIRDAFGRLCKGVRLGSGPTDFRNASIFHVCERIADVSNEFITRPISGGYHVRRTSSLGRSPALDFFNALGTARHNRIGRSGWTVAPRADLYLDYNNNRLGGLVRVGCKRLAVRAGRAFTSDVRLLLFTNAIGSNLFFGPPQ